MQDDCVELSVLSAEERRGESRRGHWPERLTFITRSETDTTSTVITVSTGVVHGLARAPTARARVIIITNYATIMQILLLSEMVKLLYCYGLRVTALRRVTRSSSRNPIPINPVANITSQTSTAIIQVM